MAGGRVTLEERQGVGWITLERPRKLNALGGDMREQLRKRIAEAARDEGLRALVITGAGRAFCAGGDVEVMARLRRAGDEAGFRALVHAGAQVVLALRAFPGLTVAAVNGVAAGAGLALALACDLRIASDDARFGASWGRIALVPDWGASYWLSRHVGLGRALEMVLTGRLVDAVEAERIGLVQRVVPAAQLAAEAQRVTLELSGARQAVVRAKELMRSGTEEGLEAALAREADAQEACFATEDAAEGLAAFLDGRPGRFRGQ